jgi:hypothetical protein
MKLTVKNLGPVSEADIDLDKRLLIFTGENNTGKTYLVYTVYHLYGVTSNVYGLHPSLVSDYERILIKPFEGYEVNLLDLTSDESDYLTDFEKHISTTLKSQLAEFFSAPKGTFNDVVIDFSIDKKDVGDKSILDLGVSISTSENGTLDKDRNSPLAVFDAYFDTSDENYDELEMDITDFVADTIFSLIKDAIFHDTYIFTAEREGINLFNKELLLFRNKAFQKLISDKKQTNELVDFMRTRFDRYPQPIRDALSEQNNYDVIKSKLGNYAHLAKELEDTFLKGDIVLNTEGDVVFKPKSMDKPLDIHLTSSTVKSLSSLIVYLRHTAKIGDSIIIDEPELNLHPDNQRKIARFFGRLINEGFKVLISTHSDYIVRELNNLIMLSHGFATQKEDTQRLLKDYNYDENELIAADKVGVYLFRVGKPVEKVEVEETGFNIATIDEEIRKLNQSSQDIYLTLFDQ